MSIPSDEIYEGVRDLVARAEALPDDHHLGDVMVVAEVRANDNTWAGVYVASGSLDGREVPPWRVAGLARYVEQSALTEQPEGDDDA